MTNTYIFQIKLKTKLKKASFNWKSQNTSFKDMEKMQHFDHMENTFFINIMTFSKSRHSLVLGITAASPFMKMHLNFCEWLSSFIWLDTAGKWHNEKGKWKFFFFSLLENQKMYKSYLNWSISCLYCHTTIHLNTHSVFYFFVNNW